MTHPPDPPLRDLLACPRCGKTLSHENGLRCVPCNVEYPRIGGIPWLFAEPGASIAEWRTRMNRSLRQIEFDANKTAKALESADLHALSARRLARMRDAQTAHARELSQLLAPLAIDDLPTSLAVHLALRTRVAPAQGLTTYSGNLHRDWCWGAEENRLSFELVAASLPKRPGMRLLVLGAGGGRLAYDLHMGLAPEATVALDVNPMLSLAAERIIRGDTLVLHEFPLAPKTSADVAVERSLAAPSPVSEGFHWILADALRAPFVDESFDAVVTPWFVDVVDERFATLAKRINRLLRPGGTWTVFGSMRFAAADPADAICADEAAAFIADAGFAPVDVVESTIPYLCSPASRHARRETVVAIGSTKSKRIPAPERHSALPEWLIRSNQPIPLLEGFRVQAATTQLYALLMSMIDGRRSLRDMAVLMEQRRLMPQAEAEAALRDFLIKMYDESRAAAAL